jgi:hypothetical protein
VRGRGALIWRNGSWDGVTLGEILKYWSLEIGSPPLTTQGILGGSQRRPQWMRPLTNFAKPCIRGHIVIMSSPLYVYFFLKPVCNIWDNSQHEPLGILSLLPSADMNIGVSGTPIQWWTWRAPCEKCRTLISYRKGIFCANFFTGRGNWKPFQKAWCRDCYTPLKGYRFPVILSKER